MSEPSLNSRIIPLWDSGDSHVRKWWLNPFRFVDTDDILKYQRRAYVFFMDLLVNRPTEFKALLLMFVLACRNLDEDALTERQAQAVALARQAVVAGQPPVMYVANSLDITKQAASQLLHRADTQIRMLTFEDLFHVYDSGEQQISWKPTEQQIKQQMAKMTRECAASGSPGCQGTTRGQFALCWPCSQVYGKTRESWMRREKPITWLLEEARRIDKQLRDEAVNELYRAHVGYEYEDIADAA